MSIKLVKALLNKEFYDKYKHKLSKDFFVADNNVKGLFQSLEKAYETIDTDLTTDSLRELHYSYNPTLTSASKNVLDGIFKDLNGLDLTTDTLEVVLKQAIEQQLWTELANIGISGGDGLKTDFNRAQEIIDAIREGVVIQSDYIPVEGTIEDMLAATDQQMQWKFHIATLAKRIDGIGKSTFTGIAARPNVGKTGFTTSLIAQPEGFLAQGAHVTYIGNEEAAVRTRLRMASCYTGLKREDFADKDKRAMAEESWGKIKTNLTVLDWAGGSIEELTKYVKEQRHPIDILVVDVLDKLSIGGNHHNESEKLYRLYTSYRELLKKYEIAGIGTSQASADAENRAFFGMDCLANSKTGKGGEFDVCFCLGRYVASGEKDQGLRTINIAKNKLTGVEDYVNITMDFTTSRTKA